MPLSSPTSRANALKTECEQDSSAATLPGALLGSRCDTKCCGFYLEMFNPLEYLNYRTTPNPEIAMVNIQWDAKHNNLTKPLALDLCAGG